MLNLSRIVRVSKRFKREKFYSSLAVKEKENAELQRTVEKISRITTKEIKKRPQREPLVKNFFMGVCDSDLLAFPEVLDKKQVDSLESDVAPIKEFYESIVREDESEFNRGYMEDLYKLKLLGLRAPSLNEGRQLTLTETLRFYEEIAKAEGKIGIIRSQQLGLQTLLSLEKPNFKLIIKDLIEGKSIAGFCINEGPSEKDLNNTTKAVLSSDGKYWVLNGNKKSIVNGDKADIFVVLTEIEKLTKRGLKEKKLIGLMVGRSDGGITSKPCDLIGLKGTDIADVSFINTPIPIENVLGEFELNDKTITSILSENRLTTATIISTNLRKVINKFIEHCINSDIPQGNLAQTEVIQEKVGKMVTCLYAIESLGYLTAGLIDEFEDQNAEVESSIAKVFSIENSTDVILDTMKFIGTSTLEKSNVFNRLYRDSLTHLLLHESLDSSKIIIALMGLQHVGKKLNDKISVLRNPFFNPGEAFKRLWTQRADVADKPKLTLKLHEYLHPALKAASEDLEYCILRLKFATEVLLARHGPDIVGKHIELKRLADSVIDIYAIFAVLARANRSYCIGLQHGAMEMEISMAFTALATERVKENVNKIVSGPFVNMDEKYLNVGKYAVTNKSYYPVHPLSRIL